MRKVLFILFGFVFVVALLVGVVAVSSHFEIGAERSSGGVSTQPVAAAEPDEPDESAPEVQEPPPVAAGRPDIHGFLSRVEYNDNVAYILGSMHLGRENWFPLNPVAENAMRRADVFAFEIDLGDLVGLIDSLILGAELSLLPDGMTLEDVVPPDIFANFIEMLETYPQVTYEDIAMLTPVAAVNEIFEIEFQPHMGIYIEYSVDLYVLGFAMGLGRPTIGLNDASDETRFMLDIPLDVQAYALVDFADWMTSFVATMSYAATMIEAYETQNIEVIRAISMDAYYGAEYNAYLQFMHDVFIQRCEIFAQSILSLLSETDEPTTFFITVGAAHVAYGHVFGVLEAYGLEIVELWR